ncbi:hypothetical protein Hamer_G023693 [Homarus americanus]|uniref:Uncharacterized protein n=1 Tax=Homarus americanus TaxID=6706 RepID=A0A8J5MLA5_HOMAM|nr:hypothetical protein Hamer_G023693 [Homarus americanus]
MCLLYLLQPGVVLLLYLQQTGAVITSMTFRKIVLSSDATRCLEEEVPLPTPLPYSARYFCALQCFINPSCTAVCPTATTCRMLNLMTSSVSGSNSSPTGLGDTCYASASTSTPPLGEDLAYGKHVVDEGTWNDKYAPGYTVVSGSRCEMEETDCFCSPYQVTPYLKVYLGSPQPVATVVITVSKFWPSYFYDVDIHVGNDGDSGDELLMNYKEGANEGEVLTLRGSTTLVGRYVSLYRRGLLTNSLCFCLLQVYSV